VSLSVIVTSYNSPATLRKCLDSLARQPGAEEVLVADCSPEDPAGALKPLFPRVRFLHYEGRRSAAELRWAAFRQARGETIAATEARCIPSPDWCGELLSAHREFPEVPAIGGPVELARPASAFDLGLYFCEYAAFAPPVQPGEVEKISGANLSYKRSALEQSSDLLEAGASETLLHERWLRQGRRLRLSRASVVFENSLPRRAAIRQQFHSGRRYAADRVSADGVPRRMLFAAGTPALPAVLLRRQALAAGRSGDRGAFRRGVAWTLLLDFAWSAGELSGYLFGEGSGPRIF